MTTAGGRRLVRCTGGLLLSACFGWACLCGSYVPLCQRLAKEGSFERAFYPGATVFLGKVLTVTPATRERILASQRSKDARDVFDSGSASLTRVEVIEAFLDAKPGEIVEIVQSDSICDIPFEVGSRYIVVAGRHGGLATVSMCSGTQPVDGHTEEALEALRAVRDGKPVVRSISGQVYDANKRNPSGEQAGVPNLTLTLKGPGRNRRVVTDEAGFFSFRKLRAGNYQIDSRTPGWYMSSWPVTVGAGCQFVFPSAKQQH